MSLKSTLMALSFVAVASLFGGTAAHAEEAKHTVTVKEGDTLSAIAAANGTDYIRLFNANETIANPDVIDVGMEIRIPAADEQLTDRYTEYAANIVTASAPAPATSVAATAPATTAYNAPAPTYSASSAGNTYAYGWCTWYVKSRKPNIPNSWGNAYAWIGSAQASGYATGSTPVAGAIGASGGHVVYVESTDGVNVSISEMAYAGGIGVVHYRTVPASSFYYIYA